MNVSVLFARSDSVYKSFGFCDVWDKERNALLYSGVSPVVAHPPCRAWGRLRYFARPVPGEKEMAFFAVDQVRRCGGVLEHPVASKLWEEYGLPRPGQGFDECGGYSIQVNQFWWGHKAEKATWLYIVGVDKGKLEPAPLVFSKPEYVVSTTRGAIKKPEISKAEREHTPLDFAKFLIDIAIKAAKL